MALVRLRGREESNSDPLPEANDGAMELVVVQGQGESHGPRPPEARGGAHGGSDSCGGNCTTFVLTRRDATAMALVGLVDAAVAYWAHPEQLPLLVFILADLSAAAAIADLLLRSPLACPLSCSSNVPRVGRPLARIWQLQLMLVLLKIRLLVKRQGTKTTL